MARAFGGGRVNRIRVASALCRAVPSPSQAPLTHTTRPPAASNTSTTALQLEVFAAGGKGWGLRVLEPVAAGQLIIEYVGEIIGPAEKARRMTTVSDPLYILTSDP
jgi:hypothetical protein